MLRSLGLMFLADLYKEQSEALPQYRKLAEDDVRALEAWAGVRDGQWSDEQTDRFVRQFELYMVASKPGTFPEPQPGERPHPVVQRVLQRMFTEE